MFQIAYCSKTAGINRSTPSPASADNATSGTPRHCGSNSPIRDFKVRKVLALSSIKSHLLTATTIARPSRST
ncbi:MAG: hypothetical protein ACKVS5_11200, partial [Parvularculaceae bacterium]